MHDAILTQDALDESLNANSELMRIVSEKKYQLKTQDGTLVEHSFDDVISRICRQFCADSKYSRQETQAIQEMLRAGRFIPAGSILYGYGNQEANCSLSNCYLVKVEKDDIESIFEAQKRLARVFSLRGGSGVDITVLRPAGSPVNNAALSSSGAVSFMPLFSEVVNTIGQNGRRAASIITLDIRHPDTLKFVWCKAKPEEVFGRDALTGKLPDVTGANISLKLTDEFMSAVANDEDWEFIFPDIEADKDFYNENWDGNYDTWTGKIKSFGKVKARDVLRQIAEASHMIGDPGVMFITRAQEYTTSTYIDPALAPISSNPCFRGDMHLLTSEGYKTFAELEGQYVEVVNPSGGATPGRVWKSGTKRTVRVSFGAKYAPIVCTPDHVFMLIDGSECRASDLLGKRVAVPLYGHFTQHPRRAVMAGFLLGDGILTDMNNPDKSGLTACIGAKDGDIGDLFGLPVKSDVRHYSREWAELAKDFELEPVKVDSRRLPKKTLTDDATLRGFLCGLYSANGSICGGRVTLKTTSSGLARDVVEALESLGIRAYITTNKPSTIKWDNGVYTSKESYDVNIANYKGRIEFFNRIGFVHTYKTNLLRDILISSAPKVMTVREAGVADVYDFTEPEMHWGIVNGVVVHNCGEVVQPYWANCLLGALVLHKYVSNPWTPNAHFRVEDFLADVRLSVLFMDTISDINIEKHPLQEQRDMDRYSKQLGIEFTGLGDCLAMLGLEYGSNEAISWVESVLSLKAYVEMETSATLAQEFECCAALNSQDSRERLLTSPYVQNLHLSEDVKALILKYGLRNTTLNTVGPTGSISIMVGNCTSGIEPVFAFSYQRQTRLSDSQFSFIHPVAASHINEHRQDLIGKPLHEVKKALHYVEAGEIGYKQRIAMQAAAQLYCDKSISSTVNLPEDATVETIMDIYIEAWRHGLKGITIFRDGCKKGVLSTKKEEKQEVSTQVQTSEFIIKDLLDVERAERHRVYWKGGKMYVTTSLDEEDQPLEIFVKLPRDAGINGGGVYNGQAYQETFSLWETITRLISLLLRAGAPLPLILKQLDKGSYSLVDASSVLARVLRTYLPNPDASHEEIVEQGLGSKCAECGKDAYIYENGCGHCVACGHSTCG